MKKYTVWYEITGTPMAEAKFALTRDEVRKWLAETFFLAESVEGLLKIEIEQIQ